MRKFIHQVQADSPLPEKGAKVLAGGREAGVITSTHGKIGLAHLRVDEVRRAIREKIPLMAEEVALTATLPAWCTTAFEET